MANQFVGVVYEISIDECKLQEGLEGLVMTHVVKALYLVEIVFSILNVNSHWPLTSAELLVFHV